MGNINHLYLVVKGAYEDAELVQESWQFGLRLMPSLNALDPIGSPPMAFDADSQELTGDSTNWTSQSNFLCEGGINDLDPATYLTTVGEAIKTWFEATNTAISGAVIITDLSLYAVGANGRVVSLDVGPAKATAVPKAALDGANAGGLLPLQIAQVVSLRTNNSSKRGRGRVYLPGMTSTSISGTNGTMNATFRTNMLGTFKTLLEALSIGSGGSPPIVRPVVIGSPWTTYYQVTEIRMGNLLDTQRRRRRQLEEVYTVAAITSA